MTPIFVNNIIALTLPWLELLIGIGIILGIYMESLLRLTILLLIMFIFILAQAVYRGIDTNCGCFKITDVVENTDFKFLLIKRIFEDVVFLTMALVLKFQDNIIKEK